MRQSKNMTNDYFHLKNEVRECGSSNNVSLFVIDIFSNTTSRGTLIEIRSFLGNPCRSWYSGTYLHVFYEYKCYGNFNVIVSLLIRYIYTDRQIDW